MSGKQPELNGAFYGPAIQPAKSYERPGRGGGCGGCCGCLFSLILKLILSVVIIVGIAVFLVWLIVRPNVVKFHVTDATLTQFNYTGNTLHYDLALNVSVRNPNKRVGIYYDRIEARALYHDARFDTELPSPFYQGHKSTNVISTVFKGQQVLPLTADQTSLFKKDNATRVYPIHVKMYLRVRFKLGLLKTMTLKPKVSCDLQVPLQGTAGVFQTTKCDYDH
ncbi:NDR1/HIN1-like protein 10 [Cajanus cajan]|uniref:Syntaxin-24 n=1 Tax=Cajanus cajan TaxID=3821 RepID=A0A151S1A5_CAJCA|nr:NDR1/HIN1-like protein 10 [Cajanus cajan]KYP48566.1 Putative syntaxin-24 [Cajanus cajan]